MVFKKAESHAEYSKDQHAEEASLMERSAVFLFRYKRTQKQEAPYFMSYIFQS